MKCQYQKDVDLVGTRLCMKPQRVRMKTMVSTISPPYTCPAWKADDGVEGRAEEVGLDGCIVIHHHSVPLHSVSTREFDAEVEGQPPEGECSILPFLRVLTASTIQIELVRRKTELKRTFIGRDDVQRVLRERWFEISPM